MLSPFSSFCFLYLLPFPHPLLRTSDIQWMSFQARGQRVNESQRESTRVNDSQRVRDGSNVEFKGQINGRSRRRRANENECTRESTSIALINPNLESSKRVNSRVDNAGQQRATKVNKGQQRSTKVNKGQQRSTRVTSVDVNRVINIYMD